LLSRRRSAALVLVLIAGAIALLWVWTRPSSPEDRNAAAEALAAGIGSRVTVVDDGLLAARAIADFGVGAEVRLVLVRIIDELDVDIWLEPAHDIALEPPIVACLVGPDATPDDAGLEDRCWGDADLGALIEAQLSSDAQGRLRLVSGSPVTVHATLRRGAVRCDYPPGAWRLELLVNPVVEGSPAGPRYAPDASFTVPFVPDEALSLVGERRYCGLASKIFREQGEPSIVTP
jgi:hypothetical protein